MRYLKNITAYCFIGLFIILCLSAWPAVIYSIHAKEKKIEKNIPAYPKLNNVQPYCIEGHTYYHYFSFGGFAGLAPKLLPNGKPEKCKEKGE
jgi:hypothetical protein